MSRGRLIPPNLDDRTWQDIVDEAKALIPRYAPDWTDHNPSDPGIALIELFAWIVEGMIYRLNRVPEKNYIEFLNLLGITRDPATPASTFLTYQARKSLEIPKGSQASTQQIGNEEAIVFETDEPLTVLPINLTTALDLSTTTYKNVTTQLVGSPLSGKTIEIPGNESITIALGFDNATAEEIRLRFRFSTPAKENDIKITWHYSQGKKKPVAWPLVTNVHDGTDQFKRNGVVKLSIPKDGEWTSQNPKSWTGVYRDLDSDKKKQELYWLSFTISNASQTKSEIGLEYILFNSVSATNALTIKDELLGVSNGNPFQFFELRNQPLFKRPGARDPYDHLKIEVREPKNKSGFENWTEWTHVDDFPEDSGHYFRLDPVTGTIYFGNGSHGRIPPAGSEIRGSTYRYVIGGVKGNVPLDTINVIRTPIDDIISVTNLVPARGGSDEETIEEAKRRAPQILRNRYRAVTVEDYEYLAKEASTDVKKVRCLPPRFFTRFDAPKGKSEGDPWTYGGLNRDSGHVNVIIIPDAPLSDPRPMPSEELLQEVSDYLEERRIMTTVLHVTGPKYLPINVAVNIKIWEEAEATDPDLRDKVEKDIEGKITDFLHPLSGESDQKGWEVGQNITISGLFEFIQPDPEIGFISEITVQAGIPLYEPKDQPFVSSPSDVWVQLADYEIICSGTHTVKALVFRR